MTASRPGALYSKELLALSLELAGCPFEADAAATGNARSRSCGSTIEVSSDNALELQNIGLRVTACAFGQASAAIFAREAAGMSATEVAQKLKVLAGWLECEAPSTILPRLELLESARAHRGRHEAILLPWRAALDALSKPASAR